MAGAGATQRTTPQGCPAAQSHLPTTWSPASYSSRGQRDDFHVPTAMEDRGALRWDGDSGCGDPVGTVKQDCGLHKETPGRLSRQRLRRYMLSRLEGSHLAPARSPADSHTMASDVYNGHLRKGPRGFPMRILQLSR